MRMPAGKVGGALLLGALGLALGLARQPAAGVAPVTFERQALTLLTPQTCHRLTVEVAHTPAQRRRGLMERDTLAPDAGMLFLYPHRQPASGAFWMFRTRIPLDIAFLADDGRILAMHRLTPCRSAASANCPSTAAGVPFHAALEVNAGYFAARGVAVGDCAIWAPEAQHCTPRRE